MPLVPGMFKLLLNNWGAKCSSSIWTNVAYIKMEQNFRYLNASVCSWLVLMYWKNAGASIPLRQWCVLYRPYSSYFHKIPLFSHNLLFILLFILFPLFWPWCIYASCFTRTGRPAQMHRLPHTAYPSQFCGCRTIPPSVLGRTFPPSDNFPQ